MKNFATVVDEGANSDLASSFTDSNSVFVDDLETAFNVDNSASTQGEAFADS